MKKIAICTTLLLSVFSLASCANNSEQKEETRIVKDMLNREVEIVNEPSKFVCIGPGCLRQYCYVADVTKLVGIENCEQTDSSLDVKPYLNKIPNYKELPIIGEGGSKDKTNDEQILKVNPDIIFTSYVSDPNAIELLQKRTGIPVVAVGYNSNGLFAEDIYNSLKLIGDITNNVSRAEAVVNYFENSKNELSTIANKNPSKERAYVGAVNHRGSFGIESTTGDFPIFDVLKIKNIVHEENITNFAKIDKEALLRLQPDKIIIDAGGLSKLQEDMKVHPSYYAEFNAFKNKEVYVELPFVFYSNNFDVALANAYFVGSVFYPNEFKNFDIKTKFNEIEDFLLGVDVYDKITTHYHCDYGKLNYTL